METIWHLVWRMLRIASFASCLPQFSGDDCIDFDADLWVQEAHLNSWFIHVLFGKSISSDEKVTRLLGGGVGSWKRGAGRLGANMVGRCRCVCIQFRVITIISVW